MKKSCIVSFLAVCLLVSGHLAAQEGRMLNAHGKTLEWAYLQRIANGENIPTTVQSISVRESEFYGLDTGITTTDAPAIKPLVVIQPFVIAWHGIDTSRDLTDESLMDRFRLDDPALLLGLSFSSYSLYGTTEIDFGTDSLTRYSDKNGITGFWNPLDYISYWTFPEEGYLSWSNKHVTLAAGRLATGIGLGKENIFLNGNARWYDQLQASWWSEHFRLFCFWGTSSSQLSDTEYKVQSFLPQDRDPKSNATQEDWGWDNIDNHDASTQSIVPLKIFTYHRFEFKPTDKIGLAFAEMQLVGGKVPDLANLLPTVVWHNTYSAGVSNVMLQADAWAVPLDGLLVYGEYLMDDTKAPKESGASKPNCWGWELGSTVVLPVKTNDWKFSLNAEYSHIDKWTYCRWQPYLTMYQRQILTGGHCGFDTPLGDTEGPDVDQVGITFTALSRLGNRVEVAYTYIDKGPVFMGMVVNNPYYTATNGESEDIPVYYDFDNYMGKGALDKYLGHIRKHSHVLKAKVSWPLMRNIEANGAVDVRYILNAGFVAGQTAVQAVYKLGVKWSYNN